MIPWRNIGIYIVATTTFTPAQAVDADLYRTTVIVTGQSEINRRIGFGECFDRILVRVSGDQRLPQLPAAKALRQDAGRLVASFSYRDRMAGTPIHDEQGTYDRPHDLTCVYDPATLDPVLQKLGSHPWLAIRPTVSVFLSVERDNEQVVVTEDSTKTADMRESFASAARPLAMKVRFPASGDFDLAQWRELVQPPVETPSTSLDKHHATPSALIGSLVWNDDDLGWVADWTLHQDGHYHRWRVRGVNFDEAFRVGMRGVAQILSGHGAPQ